MPETEESMQATASENQLVTFELDGEEFGFDIMSVQEIIRVPKVSRLPRTPDYVEGLANLRGVVLPIIDTRTRFHLPRAEETDRTRVLVIDSRGVKVGLRVDRVKQVTRMSSSNVERPPAAIRGVSADYLSGVVKLDGGKRIIMALSPEKICGIDLDASARKGVTDGRVAEHHSGDTRTGATEAVEQLVTFELGGEEFAFRIASVREILRVSEPNEVPDTPDFVLGVLTVRGNILPILDLRRLLQQSPLADEMCARVRSLRERCDGVIANHHSTAGACLPELELIRAWLASFSSSSEALMHTVTKVRSANENAIRQASAAKGAGDSALGGEFLEFLKEVSASLLRLENEIPAAISEDQRIVVVEANGVLLGLVVDHVNEVLNVAKAAIDEPPKLGTQTGVALSGIAKLNDGARLIMLLDADHLIKDDALGELGGQRESHSGPDLVRESRTSGASRSDEQQLVTFRLGSEEFGIPIAHIQEIDRFSQITRVPKAPHFVEGVTNLRGEVIPVIDARKRFAMEVKEADDRTRIIIVELAGTKTGLLVDSVSQVLNISSVDIAPPPSAIETDVDAEFISGIGKVDNGKRMILLLDVEKILSRSEKTLLKKATKKN